MSYFSPPNILMWNQQVTPVNDWSIQWKKCYQVLIYTVNLQRSEVQQGCSRISKEKYNFAYKIAVLLQSCIFLLSEGNESLGLVISYLSSSPLKYTQWEGTFYLHSTLNVIVIVTMLLYMFGNIYTVSYWVPGFGICWSKNRWQCSQ